MAGVRHAEPGFHLQVVGQRRSAHILLAFPLGEGGPLVVDEGLKKRFGAFKTPQNKPHRMMRYKVQRDSVVGVRHAEPDFSARYAPRLLANIYRWSNILRAYTYFVRRGLAPAACVYWAPKI